MACGSNNITRIRAQVVLLSSTFRKAHIDEKNAKGFIGRCYAVSDRCGHTIVVDVDYARVAYARDGGKFNERITKGEWTTVPFVVSATDGTCQAIGKHLVICLVKSMAEIGAAKVRTLIKGGYYNDFVVNHMTGNVDEDHYTEGCTEQLNRLHGRVIREMAKQLCESPLWYYPSDAKRNGKHVLRTALKFPLSVSEIEWVYEKLVTEGLIKSTGKEAEVVRLIADRLIKVWMPVYMYGLESISGYPMHDELLHYKRRKDARSLILAHIEREKVAYDAEELFYSYEAQMN